RPELSLPAAVSGRGTGSVAFSERVDVRRPRQGVSQVSETIEAHRDRASVGAWRGAALSGAGRGVGRTAPGPEPHPSSLRFRYLPLSTTNIRSTMMGVSA